MKETQTPSQVAQATATTTQTTQPRKRAKRIRLADQNPRTSCQSG